MKSFVRFKQKAGGIWNRKCGHGGMETAGFCWTGPHGRSGRQVSGLRTTPLRGTLCLKERHAARMGTQSTVYMRDMWQAVKEMGSIGRRPTTWDRPGLGKGGRVRCAGGPHSGESGKSHETQCEWGSRSPPAFHWLDLAWRVPGWTSEGSWSAIFAPPKANSLRRTVPILVWALVIGEGALSAQAAKLGGRGPMHERGTRAHKPTKTGSWGRPRLITLLSRAGHGTSPANARKLSLLKRKVNRRP